MTSDTTYWLWKPDALGDYQFIHTGQGLIVVERLSYDDHMWHQIGTITSRALTFAGRVRACRRYLRTQHIQLRLPNILEEDDHA